MERSDVALSVNTDGPSPTLDQVLSDTNMVVRAVIGKDGAKLSTGTEVIALLHDESGRHVAAGGTAIFQVRDSVIVPLVKRPGEHQTSSGMNADAFMKDIVARRQH